MVSSVERSKSINRTDSGCSLHRKSAKLIGDNSYPVPKIQDQPTSPTPAAEFDKFAGEYDVLLADPLRDAFGAPDFFHRRKWELIQRYLESSGLDSKSMAWLDVGCGRGELLNLAGDSFQLALGCDPSKEMIGPSRAVIHWQPVQSELPFAGETFDLVTAVCVFHHVPLPLRPALVSEVLRVMRPNGLFCVIEHNPFNPVTRWIVARTPVDSGARLLSAGETSAMLGSRFQAIDTRYFLFAPQKLYALAGKLEPMLQRCPVGGQYAVFAGRRSMDSARPGKQPS
jgi:SAM-dependent methyltransferase